MTTRRPRCQSAFDPFSDMMFSCAAIVLVTLLAVLAIVPTRPAAHLRDDASAPEALEFTVDGRTVKPFVASPRGILYGQAAAELVPLDRVLDDAGLAAELARHRDAGIPVALIIAPRGSEAAFLFEAVAHMHGPATIRQVRLDAGCAYRRALARFCIDARRRAGGPAQ